MVRCADCGFLAARNLRTRQLDEVEALTRESGMHAEAHTGDATLAYGQTIPIHSYLHDAVLLCFARKYNLASEVQPGHTGAAAAMFPVIRKERECDAFTDWKQGFTPREHREMLDRDRMLRREEERDAKDKVWQEKQQRYIARIAGAWAIVAGVLGATMGAFIAWLFTRSGSLSIVTDGVAAKGNGIPAEGWEIVGVTAGIIDSFIAWVGRQGDTLGFIGIAVAYLTTWRFTEAKNWRRKAVRYACLLAFVVFLVQGVRSYFYGTVKDAGVILGCLGVGLGFLLPGWSVEDQPKYRRGARIAIAIGIAFEVFGLVVWVLETWFVASGH